MQTKPTIVIIGSGSAALPIARRLSAAGHKLLLCDKDFFKAQALAKQLNDAVEYCDAEAVECSFTCAWEADIVILALSYEEQQEAAAVIKQVVSQKILIGISDRKDSCNRTAADFGEMLEQFLPNTKTVVMTRNAAAGDGTGDEEVEITSGNAAALESVANICKHAGFRVHIRKSFSNIQR